MCILQEKAHLQNNELSKNFFLHILRKYAKWTSCSKMEIYRWDFVEKLLIHILEGKKREKNIRFCRDLNQGPFDYKAEAIPLGQRDN